MSYFARITSRIAAAPAAPGIAPVGGAARPALSIRAPLSNGAAHIPFEPAEIFQSSALGDFDGDGLQGLAPSAASSLPSLEPSTSSGGDTRRGVPSDTWPEPEGPAQAPATVEHSVVDVAATPVSTRATPVVSTPRIARSASSARSAPKFVAASSSPPRAAGEFAPPSVTRHEQHAVSPSSPATEGQSALLQALGTVDAWLRTTPARASDASTSTTSTPRSPEPFAEPAAPRAEPRRAEFRGVEALPAENTPRSVSTAVNAAAHSPVETAAVSDRPLISIGRIEVEVVPPPKPAPSAPRTGPRRAPRSAFAAEASRPFGWRQR